MTTSGQDHLLSIESLRIEAGGRAIIEGVSLTIGRGEMPGLVGESGCGKSVTALSIMRLIAEPPGRAPGAGPPP